MGQLNITKRKADGGVVVLDLLGEICLGNENQQLKQTLRSLAEQNEKKIVLNLAGVTRIDSSGLGELVAGYATVTKAGGDMKLLNLSGRAVELMTIKKLHTVFDVFDNEAAAVASFPLTAEDLQTVLIDPNKVNLKAVA
jgi:anti-sigma B factor antagonist